jgi:phosphoenolpyruvate carboxykinase (ATP)
METNSFLINKTNLHYQTDSAALIEQTVKLGQGKISATGALCVHTGKFTGRSPENKYIVEDPISKGVVDWGGFNHPINEKYFIQLRDKIITHLNNQKEVWVRDVKACADPSFETRIRVYTELPWVDLFVSNMFIENKQPASSKSEIIPEWIILQAPSFEADPLIDGTQDKNFSIISFTHKQIIIGGSGYTGEIKKGIFSVLNLILPHFHKVLSMHCSANIGMAGDVALFFGLSGTGKTTLSADKERKLIGDDEHGWGAHSVFNFEGGCYAKTVKLNPASEPEIYGAIKTGALLENVVFFTGTNQVNYDDTSITENTRVSYPINYITNHISPSIGGIPKNIFFLTCDANGVLPPISKLNKEQAMYQFISGYTAKIAGTEEGIKMPKSTFSACFGAPFMPLHPGVYAKLLGEKLEKQHCTVWLINTGWTGGPYGTGERISLKATRTMIQSVLNGAIEKQAFTVFPVFNFQIPSAIEGVDSTLLDPINTWADKSSFEIHIKKLATEFTANFKRFEPGLSPDIIAAGPVLF